MSSRGRGVSNIPAWMNRQNGHAAPGSSSSQPPPTSQSTSTISDNTNNNTGNGRTSTRSRSRSRSPLRERDSYGRSSRSKHPSDRDWDRGGGSRSSSSRNDYNRHPNSYRGGDPHRDSYRGGGRYDPPPYRGGGPPRNNFRDSSRRGGGRRYNGGPPRKQDITFQSMQEEREWVEDRRRKRLARKSLFDVPPTPEQLALEAAAVVYQEHNAHLKDRSFVFDNKRGGNNSSMSRQPQQTRHARRLYIGQLPLELTEGEVHAFFQNCIKVATGKDNESMDGDDDPILSVYINRERRFAFVEFRTMEICTACLALDGINILNRGKVKIKRPNDYNPSMAPEPSSVIQFDVSKLGIVSGSVPDGPNKIFIGGLPYHLTEDQVMELLSAFGQVKAFHLVKADVSALTSKGYCFVEYSDANVTPVAVMALNGMAMGGDKVLSARMAATRVAGLETDSYIPSGVSDIDQEQARARMSQQVDGGVSVEALLDYAMNGAKDISETPARVLVIPNVDGSDGNAAPGMDTSQAQLVANSALDFALNGSSQMPSSAPPTGPSTKILVLMNMVSDEDLVNNEDYQDLYQEVKEECAKFGNLQSMKIPRPSDGYDASAVKKIFLEYADSKDSERSMKELAGRKFGPNVVQAIYFSEEEFYAGKLK